MERIRERVRLREQAGNGKSSGFHPVANNCAFLLKGNAKGYRGARLEETE